MALVGITSLSKLPQTLNNVEFVVNSLIGPGATVVISPRRLVTFTMLYAEGAGEHHVGVGN